MSKKFDSISTIKSAAAAIHAGATALDVINTKVGELREAGVKFGKSVKTCTNRAALVDAMAAAFKGKAAKTYANYVTALVAAVNDNVPFSFSASKGKANGGKGKGKGKTETELSAIIAKAFNHADFAEMVKALESDYLAAYENDEKPTLAAYFADYLKAEGFEITE